MAKLISNKVKKVSSDQADPNRYEFLSLEHAEPDLGVPAANGYLLVSNDDGTRFWTNDIIIGNALVQSLTVDQLFTTSLTFPSGDGTPGQLIATDGSGNLYFTTETLQTITDRGSFTNNNITVDGFVNASSFDGDGSSITSVNAIALNGFDSNYFTTYSTNVAIEKAEGAYANAVLYTDNKIGDLINNAPGVLDTLNELANALDDDPNFAVTITNQINNAYTNATIYAANVADAAYTNATTYADTVSANAADVAYSNATSYADSAAESAAAIAYSNATLYADSVAATSYANSVAYTDIVANTVYANAVGHADLVSDAAYSNAVTFATTAANTAYANAVLYTDNKIDELVNSAPGVLDTLNELADALGDDPNFATTVTNQINNGYSNAINYAANVAEVAYTNAISYADSIAATAYSNGVSYTDSEITLLYGNVTSYADSGDATTYSNAVSYTDSEITSLYTNVTSYADAGDATTYSNATAYADTVSDNAYANATSYADTASATAYSNATTYADTAAVTAYSNATSYADTVAGQAYTNAVAQIGDGFVDVANGAGIAGNGSFNLNDFGNTSITISHADTSSVANVDSSGGVVVQDLSFDGFGHVQTVGTIDLDARYLQSYTETDTLNSVVLRGATTNSAITVANTITANVVTGLDAPVNGTDAANKTYVDSVAEGLQIKGAVEVVTVANLDVTYDNGNNGVDATLTSNSNTAWPEVDGYLITSTSPGENGVLVTGQSNAAHNGRYNLIDAGSNTSPWILERCGACDETSEISGAFVFVKHGNTYAGTGWVQTVEDTSTFVVGTDPITVTQFSQAGVHTAGAGLKLDGLEFSIDPEATLIANGFSGNGALLTSVDAETLGGNTAADLQSYADTVAAQAYANATAEADSTFNTLGTISTQDASNVNITGGLIDNTAIDRGSINRTEIGLTTPAQAAFTNVTATYISGNGAGITSVSYDNLTDTPNAEVVTISSGATVDFDFSNNINFSVTLTQNTTFTFSNLAAASGKTGLLVVNQDVSGGHEFTLPASAKTPAGGATIAQETGASSSSVLNYFVVNSSAVFVNYIGNFA